MSYEQIYNSLSEVFNGFFNQVFNPFIDFVHDTPLLSVGLMVSALPLVLIVVDFFVDASHSTEDSTVSSNSFFFSRFNKISKRAYAKNIEYERNRQHDIAKRLSDEFFKNNPHKMSVTINGFRFLAPDFEKKNWGNSKRTTVTKTYRYDGNGELYVSGTSVRSTESYNNTSDLQLTNNYDVD